jgi:RNase H
MSQYNVVQLFWVSGHSGVEGNEKADELARMGSDWQFCEPEPFFALPLTVAKSKIKDWVTQSHYQNWRTIPGSKQSKRWLIQPSRKTVLYFLGLLRIRLRMVLSLITGHCRLNGHLNKMRLHSDPISNM